MSRIIKPYLQEKHLANVKQKFEKLKGKRSLLQAWEAEEQKNGYDDKTHKIVLDLRRQIRGLCNQLRAMDTTIDV